MLNETRWKLLWQKFEAEHLDIVLICNFESGTLYSPHPFYLTGLRSTDSAVILDVSRRQEHLLTDWRYEEAAKSVFPAERLHIVQGWVFDELFAVVAALLPQGAARIGFESNILSDWSAREFERRLPAFARLVPLDDAGNPIVSLRREKTDEEIECLLLAQVITETALREAFGKLRPGITEMAFAAEVEYLMRKKGAFGQAFESIVASGVNSAKPHARSSEKLLTTGEAIQFDVGANYRGYCGDLSRVAFLGKPDPQLKEAYAVVLDALEYGISLCKPGMHCKKLDQLIRERFGKYSEFFKHGTGHGVGLKIHELPRISPGSPDGMTLEIGDVVTIEPGLYFPEVGGIRLEEMVVIRDDGPKVLGAHIFPPDKLLCL